jgi:hypothetical protein
VCDKLELIITTPNHLSEPHMLPDFTNENDSSPKEEKFGACIVGDKK